MKHSKCFFFRALNVKALGVVILIITGLAGLSINNAMAQRTFERTYGDTDVDESGRDIVQENNDFVAVGFHGTPQSNQRIYFFTLDSCGSMYCSTTVGTTGSRFDASYAMVQNSSGDYICAGESDHWGPGATDVYAAALEVTIQAACNPSIVNSNGIGTDTTKELAFDIMIDNSSNIVMAGCFWNENTTRGNDFYLTKSQSNGRLYANGAQVYGGEEEEIAYSVILGGTSQNRRYIMAGFTEYDPFSAGPTSRCVYMLAINPSNGSITNVERVWGNSFDQEASDIIQLPGNNDYVVAGFTRYDNDNEDSDIFRHLFDPD